MPNDPDDDADLHRVLELLRSERGGAAVALAATYLRAVGAVAAEAGETWGITCLSSRDTALRINAGAQEVVQVLATGGVKLWVPDASAAIADAVAAERFEGHQSSTDAGLRFGSIDVAQQALDAGPLAAA